MAAASKVESQLPIVFDISLGKHKIPDISAGLSYVWRCLDNHLGPILKKSKKIIEKFGLGMLVLEWSEIGLSEK